MLIATKPARRHCFVPPKPNYRYNRHRFANRLRAGTVWVNTFGPTDVRLPWGGSRDSGFGREHGEMAIENFTEPKAVWINTAA